MSEIAKILRHQRERNTAIYAKVELGALRSIAHPWPGGGHERIEEIPPRLSGSAASVGF